MSFSVGRGFFTSFINNERINAISNARSESEACVMTLWEKIKNLFFHTHQKKALHLLYKLTHAFEYHDAAAFASYFFQLRNLVKPEDQNQFYITRTGSQMIGQLAGSPVLVLLSDHHGHLSSLNSPNVKKYFTVSEENKENESPEEKNTLALEKAVEAFKQDFTRGSYVFQSEMSNEKKYNLNSEEYSDQLFDEVLKTISDICLNDQEKYFNTLLLNTQKAFLATNYIMHEHDKRFPIYRDPRLVLTQESRTHRQPDDSIIVQNHACFISNPKDTAKIDIQKKYNGGVTPLFGKISIHNVWMVANGGIQGIGLHMEVTPP